MYIPIMRTLINSSHICVYQVCPCVATQEYSMLKHSCPSFVPDCFWFSDSADWMWPCDPWLPGREPWGHGCWGYGRGEPTPEDYPRSAWYASFVGVYGCVCLLALMCVNRFTAAGSCWLTWCDRKEEKEDTWCNEISVSVKSKCNLHGWNYLTFPGHRIIWKKVHLTSYPCRKGVVEASVSMQRDRECVLRMHPSRVSFQFLRWIRGKWVIYRKLCLKRVGNGN